MRQNTPQPRKALQQLDPYVPAHGLSGAERPMRLSANESALGASPKVLEMFARGLSDLQIYPQMQSEKLHQALSDRYGVRAEGLLTSNGSDELIALLAQAYLDVGDEAVITQYGFLVFPQVVQVAGATSVVAADDGYTVSVDNILACVSARTKIVFLANPNNPTATLISEAEVRRLHHALPSDVILVLDFAYSEYAPGEMDYAIKMVEENQNVVMLRTFSKLHGLAALRLGWGYFPTDILGVMGAIRGPFSVNSLAAQAGAIAVADTAFQDENIAHNLKWRSQLRDRFLEMGLRVEESQANFLLVHFDGHNGPSAAQTEAYLRSHHILVRGMTGYGLPEALRLSFSSDEDMEKLSLLMRDFMVAQST